MKSVIFLLFFISIITVGQTNFEKAEYYLNQKEYTAAQGLLLPFVASNPQNLKAIELLGDVYAHQQKWDEAITCYRNLVNSKPEIAEYHYKYGGALAMKALSISKIKAVGIIQDAKNEFLAAAELNSNHIETRWALVKMYMELPGIIGGSKKKALHYADELLQLSKVDGFLALGYIHEYSKEFRMAEAYYKSAIKEGGSMVCYNKLTALYETNKEPHKAIANLEEAFIKHKNNALNYHIGRIAAEHAIQVTKGQYHLQTYLINYSKNDPINTAWAYYRLAQLYKFQKNKAGALKNIDIAISKLPHEKAFQKEKLDIVNLQ